MPTFDRQTCERAILAACFLDPKIVPQVAAALTASDFGQSANSKMFAAIVAAERLDLPAVAEAAGWDLLAATALLDEHVTAAAWKFYVGKLRESRCRQSILGALADAAAKTRDASHRPNDVARATVESLLSAINDGLEAKSLRGAELVYPVLEELDRRTDPGYDPGPTFGLSDLDALLGGLGRGDLVLLAARPSVGKTALGLQLALHAAGDGRRVGFVSLEMGHHPVTVRMLVQLSKTSLYRALKGHLSPAEHSRIVEAGATLAGRPVAVMDASVASVADIRAEVAKTKPDLLVVDYLQLIAPEPGQGNRNEEVSGISRGLKRLALEYNLTLVALSQLKRPDVPRLPRLTDLRDSGSLEQDADVVVMLHDDPSKPKERMAIVAKHRNGPTGAAWLYWDGDRCMFADLARGVDRSRTEA